MSGACRLKVPLITHDRVERATSRYESPVGTLPEPRVETRSSPSCVIVESTEYDTFRSSPSCRRAWKSVRTCEWASSGTRGRYALAVQLRLNLPIDPDSPRTLPDKL